ASGSTSIRSASPFPRCLAEDDRLHDHARTDDASYLRWIRVLGLAHATSMGFILRPCPPRSAAPPHARGHERGHLDGDPDSEATAARPPQAAAPERSARERRGAAEGPGG